MLKKREPRKIENQRKMNEKKKRWMKEQRKKQKNRKKFDCHIIYLRNSIWVHTKKLRKSNSKNVEKDYINTICFFFLQGIPFQFRWLYLRWKMVIFHHPFTHIKKLSISLPFEPDNFFLYLDQGSPSTLGANARKISLKSWMIQMLDVERQCEKWSSKSVEFTPWRKNRNEKK